MKTTKLVVKDYITIAIFTVLMFVVSTVAGMLTTFSATFSFVIGSGVAGFFSAVVYQVLVFKIPKNNVFLVSVLLRSVIYLVMGFPQMLLTTIPAAFAGEFILRFQKTGRSLWNTTLAWSVYSALYSLHGAVMLWVFGASYLTESFPEMFSPDRMTLITSLYLDPLWIIVTLVSGFVLGGLGCLVWWQLFKRHFIKSGAVQLNTRRQAR